ncbi:hypothetical protein AVL48_15115 [Amycolatopsis regifaucium]|uniref:Uncharacterized protein n=1 Tax=Amycolatopsis regifaucium TaxID=546365 RepID=A0A154M5P9_9PSEU|nr:hypothetical protein AVL48_15115 [Amycolatopsis regifaucium]OKA10081.1 hypothetical protein ATP06_0206300 [Amycolatopsis regifaucium]
MQPGDRLSATGKGCVPGKAVTLTSDGKRVGSAYADGTGTVEQVVTSSSGGHSGTLVVLVFFVLAGITVLRFP